MTGVRPVAGLRFQRQSGHEDATRHWQALESSRWAATCATGFSVSARRILEGVATRKLGAQGSPFHAAPFHSMDHNDVIIADGRGRRNRAYSDGSTDQREDLENWKAGRSRLCRFRSCFPAFPIHRFQRSDALRRIADQRSAGAKASPRALPSPTQRSSRAQLHNNGPPLPIAPPTIPPPNLRGIKTTGPGAGNDGAHAAVPSDDIFTGRWAGASSAVGEALRRSAKGSTQDGKTKEPRQWSDANAPRRIRPG